ncbi:MULTISPECIES: alpha/beta hydrolase [unclassified Leptospira]|uniref:alpha/beta hydrolase n=1 Tax=unclassified Leptospira TaxID=2633828 RepID=UPI0002BDE06B|nr:MULTISPECIES: alpha/beta hydrolase [unclassified Leptospira]EMJ98519.1 putative carboxylesterase [Leptospira sp. B5-022]MCR1794800.1 alpha/beta hydrolase [Leptospira sp. id769339]
MEFAPEMLEYANLISSKGLTGFTQGSVQERREGYSAIGELLGEGPLVKEILDFSIPSKDGSVFIKNYIPRTEPKSKILYFHGGGWVVGRLKDFDPFARKLAEITSSIVSLVDYRLAPEFPFPLPLEDAYTSLEWISNQKENIWKDLPLVVAGDSAGGNLAASTIMRAKELFGPKIDLQILIYPVTETICNTDSYKEFEFGPGLTKKDMEWFITQYLPDPNTRSDPKASPLFQKDWKDLPPAIVFIADIDPLRDDGKLYAEKLTEAGVSVLFKEFKGYTHGFFTKVNLLKAPEEGLRMISAEMDRVFRRKEALL